jgi:hypothetical protein
MGGAIFNYGGSLAVTNCTISGNTAQGGNGYRGGSGYGAGIFNLDGTVTVLNCTFAGNTVAVGSGGTPAKEGGAIYNLQQSGTASLALRNTILANSTGGSDAYNNAGTVSGDHNLVETSSGLPGGVVAVTSDPLLGSLANSGGLTFTHALSPSSPAIDAGDDSVCAATDQRGTARPQDGNYDSVAHSDIGAYEASPPSGISVSPSSAAENQPSGTTVGTLSATDATPGDTHTFTLVSGIGGIDNGSFTISGDTLKTAASFDYETKNSYSIRVQATDQGGFTFEKPLTININNVNEAPTPGSHYLGSIVSTPSQVSARALASLDYDVDGDSLTVVAVDSPSTNGGTVSLSSDTITYTPVAGYVGADEFTYTISDGFGGMATGTNHVTVRLGKATSVFNYVSEPANSSVVLRGYGIPGHSYDIQVSGDLESWDLLAPVTAAANGIILYTDTHANTSPRYYRFVVH